MVIARHSVTKALEIRLIHHRKMPFLSSNWWVVNQNWWLLPHNMKERKVVLQIYPLWPIEWVTIKLYQPQLTLSIRYEECSSLAARLDKLWSLILRLRFQNVDIGSLLYLDAMHWFCIICLGPFIPSVNRKTVTKPNNYVVVFKFTLFSFPDKKVVNCLAILPWNVQESWLVKFEVQLPDFLSAALLALGCIIVIFVILIILL